jgi:dUTP pyrophosphatase
MLDKVSIKIVNNIIKKLPTYASDGSAGLDLHAAISSTIDLRPQETVLISTGIAIYIKDKNYAATILPSIWTRT